MKVVINQSIEMTDEQRILLANVLDDKVSRRMATRNEARDFIWSQGMTWSDVLDEDWNREFGDSDEPETDDEYDDLL